jgi:hypothetical protein
MLKMKEEIVVQPNEKPKVGVVVINLNSYELTSSCLTSLQRQLYKNIEIIVVDNGSKDDSPDKLEKDFFESTLITILRLPENSGFVGGSNRGIREALLKKCSLIFLLNNDTIADEALLDEMVKVVMSDPKCGIVNPKVYYFEKPDRIQSMGMDFSLWKGIGKMRGRKKLDRGQFEYIEEVPCANGCALMIKAELINHIGLLDDHYYIYCEDIDWSLRAKKAGYKILFAPAGKVWHKEDFGREEKRNQSFIFYLSSRNALWLFYNHAKWFQCFTAIPCLLIGWVGKLLLLSIIRKDYSSLWAVVYGVRDFIRMTLGIREDEIKELEMNFRIGGERVV